MSGLLEWTFWLAVLLAGMVGLGIQQVAGWVRSELQVTAREFAAGMVACLLVVVPVTTVVGTRMARANLLRYDEFWGGFELGAERTSTPCDRDGPCVHEYDCDSYNHVHHETRQVASGTDSKGNTTYRTEHYTENHTHWHSCPYATEEWSFTVNTTLGRYTVVDHGFPDQPVEWRAGSGIPASVHRGVPAFWAAAKERVDARRPGPVTAVRQYDNFILASQTSILKEYSASVEELAEKGYLPAPTTGVRDLYLADKVHFVGVDADRAAWQDTVNRFNAAFGSDLQGDLHVVLVTPGRAGNIDTYTGAMNALWTGPKYGRKALSKNALVVVIATDGKTVSATRAFTGMPLGNEKLLAAVRSIADVPLDPAAVIGAPVGVLGDNGKVTVQVGDGRLEKLAWSPATKFTRVCMRCEEEGGGGFTYLDSEIQPTTGQRLAIAAAGGALSILVWLALLFTGAARPGRWSTPTRTARRSRWEL